MGEDRSLDEFADAGSDDGSAGDSADAEGKPEDPDEERAAESSAAEPAVPTATWTTDGAACDRCGESDSRRWIDGDELVCAACKEW